MKTINNEIRLSHTGNIKNGYSNSHMLMSLMIAAKIKREMTVAIFLAKLKQVLNYLKNR